MRKWIAICAALAILAGCSRREEATGFYVLQELEAASAVKNPAERIERLGIFAANHKEHPYRVHAFKRIAQAYRDDLRDTAAAEAYLDTVLAREAEPYARGEILIDRFDRLLGADSLAAYALAETVLVRERYARLFLWMGYSLWDDRGRPDLARACFLKTTELGDSEEERTRAYGALGEWLVERGEKSEGSRFLALASGDPEAMKVVGDLLWAGGRFEQALESYIGAAAVMPRLREELGLDSLYALRNPGAADLDRRIMEKRIGDRGALAPRRFADMNGRSIDLSKLAGRKIVLYAWSPT